MSTPAITGKKIIVVDLDEVANWHLYSSSRVLGDAAASSPFAATLEAWEQAIKDGYVSFWDELGMEVYDCPDSEVQTHLAARWLDPALIYEAEPEEYEAAVDAAWAAAESQFGIDAFRALEADAAAWAEGEQ